MTLGFVWLNLPEYENSIGLFEFNEHVAIIS